MTPDYRIIADTQDVTRAIADRLLDLRLSDEAGEQADRLDLTLDDRGRTIALPRTGAELQVSLGYRERGLVDMGLWVVDEVELSGPPARLRVRARAANLSNSDTLKAHRNTLRQHRNQSWHDLTLGDLVATIAERNGYRPRVGEFLAPIHISHLDQTDESDLHLLTRLGRQYDAVAKPAGGYLLFVERGQAKSASGKSLTPVTLTPSDVTHWQVRLADRGKYKAVIAHWHDTATARRIPVRVGQAGEPVRSLRGDYPDEAAATAAARALLERLNRGAATASLTLPGRPELAAGTPVRLDGFGPGVDGEWVATRAEHALGRSGYQVRLELETKEAS